MRVIVNPMSAGCQWCGGYLQLRVDYLPERNG